MKEYKKWQVKCALSVIAGVIPPAGSPENAVYSGKVLAIVGTKRDDESPRVYASRVEAAMKQWAIECITKMLARAIKD